ncbi:MAG: hypothetical protein VB051_12155 [Candidatus Pelethousia sp.]|nr:hypothetical protein [Candidatus Pelethousia sp.]
MRVTFCGHAVVSEYSKVEGWLREVVTHLIAEGATIFYIESYGDFDWLAASAVWEEQKKHANVLTTLVMPYPRAKIDTSRYGYSVYPPMESAPIRFAVSKRNLQIVETSDVVVAYVTHERSEAAKTLHYARHKQKKIIQFPIILPNPPPCPHTPW